MKKTRSLLCIILILTAVCASAASRRFTLVIDAGHGGHDAGAMGSFSKEKNINLAVALQLGKYVEREMPDVRVVYTRKTDVFIPLKERASIANRANADLFISVHTNALPGGKVARGFETYTLGMHRAKDNLDVAMRENSVISMEKDYQQAYQGFDPKSSESYIIFEFIQGKNMERSVELAKMIQNSVCSEAGRPDKGVHQAGFLVLRETSMPACLIELGFISTPDEERTLNDTEQTDRTARAIYEAVARYRAKYDANTTVPYRATSKKETEMPSIVPENYKKGEKRQTQTDKQMAKTDKQQPQTPAPTQVQDSSRHRQSRPGRQTEQASIKKQEAKTASAPIFKLQIFVSGRVLRSGDAHFKGLTGCEYYREGGLVKYTTGASANYNEIYTLRKKLADKFPESFIIAFKDGEKYDVNQAIKEYKKLKN